MAQTHEPLTSERLAEIRAAFARMLNNSERGSMAEQFYRAGMAVLADNERLQAENERLRAQNALLAERVDAEADYGAARTESALERCADQRHRAHVAEAELDRLHAALAAAEAREAQWREIGQAAAAEGGWKIVAEAYDALEERMETALAAAEAREAALVARMEQMHGVVEIMAKGPISWDPEYGHICTCCDAAWIDGDPDDDQPGAIQHTADCAVVLARALLAATAEAGEAGDQGKE